MDVIGTEPKDFERLQVCSLGAFVLWVLLCVSTNSARCFLVGLQLWLRLSPRECVCKVWTSRSRCLAPFFSPRFPSTRTRADGTCWNTRHAQRHSVTDTRSRWAKREHLTWEYPGVRHHHHVCSRLSPGLQTHICTCPTWFQSIMETFDGHSTQVFCCCVAPGSKTTHRPGRDQHKEQDKEAPGE